MKQTDAGAGRSWASGLASSIAAAGLLVLMGSGASADVIETFDLAGSLNTVFGSLVPFTGTINLDFTNDFTSDTVKSIQITVHGRSVFKQSPSVNLAMSAIGVIGASNISGDVLSLTFTTPNPGTWNGFDNGSIVGGDVIFGGLTGMLLGADGVITRDPLDPPIIDPPVIDPPPPAPSAAVPELSTWTMMLVGLAGLGLAAKGRRALAFLRGRA